MVSFDDAMSAYFLGPTDYFSYVGLAPVRTRPYDFWLPADSPSFFVTAPVDSSGAPGWTGSIPFVITSTPDLLDNSTWTWVLNIQAHGPSLAQNVPESGGLLCLAFAAGLLLFFRPRKEKAWTS